MPEPPITDHSWRNNVQTWCDEDNYKCRSDGFAFYTTRGGGTRDARMYWWDKGDCRRIVESNWLTGPMITEGHKLTVFNEREITYQCRSPR